MDKKLFEFVLDEWKKINKSLTMVNDTLNCRDISFGQREIIYNLFKGVNRRSYRLCKMLEEARLKDETDEVKQETR